MATDYLLIQYHQDLPLQQYRQVCVSVSSVRRLFSTSFWYVCQASKRFEFNACESSMALS